MDPNTHAATAGAGGFAGEPTTATHATVYATAYSDVSRGRDLAVELVPCHTNLEKIELNLLPCLLARSPYSKRWSET
jgi:hypothetical protein